MPASDPSIRVLTTRYRFACPERGESRVHLSDFRRLERLAGTGHPAVYRVEFEGWTIYFCCEGCAATFMEQHDLVTGA